ncbi:MAG: hypothetical protein ACU84H_13320 [Gammaproteobacteria bacterium]
METKLYSKRIQLAVTGLSPQVVMSQTHVDRLLAAINTIIDRREDDVRCYSLSAGVECKTIGRQKFPDDVMLFSAGVNRLFC